MRIWIGGIDHLHPRLRTSIVVSMDDQLRTYICVDGPLADTRVDRRLPATQQPQVAILECPDGRSAIYEEKPRGQTEVWGGLYFMGYVGEAPKLW